MFSDLGQFCGLVDCESEPGQCLPLEIGDQISSSQTVELIYFKFIHALITLEIIFTHDTLNRSIRAFSFIQLLSFHLNHNLSPLVVSMQLWQFV